jgi:O-antigen ligase
VRLSTRSLVGAAAFGLLLGNLGRIPFIEVGGRVGAFTVLDLVLVPLWLLLAITLMNGARRWRFDAVSLGIIAFVCVALVSTVAAGPRWGLSLGAWVSSAAFLVRWTLYAGFFVLIVSDPEPDAAGRDAWNTLDKVFLAFALFGFVQAAFLPGFGTTVAAVTGIPADPQGHRLASTVLDPNQAGGILAVALLMRVAMAAEGLPHKRLPIALLAAALVLTLSRSAVLGVMAGVGVILLVRGFTPALKRLAFVGALVALPLIPPLLVYASEFNKLRVDASAVQRLIPWIRSVILIRDQPVLGVGFNAAGHAQRAYGWESIGGSDVSMDGGLLFVAVMTGLLGLLAYTGMLGALVRAARRTWRSPLMSTEQRGFAIGTVAATVAILVQSLFTNTLLIPWLLVPMWIAWGRVVGTARLVRLAPVAFVLVLAGCDPCAGVANCSTQPQRVIAGSILERGTDTPRSGVAVSAEGMTAYTNLQGRWRLALPPGDSLVTVAVSVDTFAYSVDSVRARTITTTGDATEVGVWYDRPFLGYVMGIIYRGVGLADARVRFTADAAFGSFVRHDTTTGSGFVRFEGPAPTSGNITGTLRVMHPSTGTRTFTGVKISGDHALQVEQIRQYFITDRTYPYGGNVFHRGSFDPSPGTTVTFTRTSGLALAQNPVSVTAGAQGFFLFSIEPLGNGTVNGTLRFTPPGGGAPYTYNNIALTTYDSTTARHIGVYAHGERWDWVFEIRRTTDSSLVTWTPFRFVRTSGLAIEPSNTVDGLINGSGRMLVRATVRDTGTVTGTLTIRPVGLPVITVGTVSLRTFAADTQNFAGIRYIPLP